MVHLTIYDINDQRAVFLKVLQGVIRYVKAQIEFKRRTGSSLLVKDCDFEEHKNIVSVLNNYLASSYVLDFNDEPELLKELSALEEKYKQFTIVKEN